MKLGLFGFLTSLCVFLSAQQPTRNVVLNYQTQSVPYLKKWVIKSNDIIKVELRNGTFDAGTPCNGFFLSNPRMLFNIRKSNSLGQFSYGVIFSKPEKVPFTNEFTYSITTVRFVDVNGFSPYDFQGKSIDDIGVAALEFYPGDKISVDNCLQGLEIMEYDITAEEALKAKERAKKEYEVQQLQIKTVQTTREKKIDDIVSKTYDLSIYDTIELQNFLELHQVDIQRVVSASKQIPSDDLILSMPNKYFQTINSYSESIRLKKAINDGTVKSGSVVDLSNRSQIMVRAVNLLAGNDTACEFVKKATTRLPTTLIDGIEVLTSADIPNLEVNFCKGFTKVKIDNGSVSFKKFPPPTTISDVLSKYLSGHLTGSYNVKYEVCLVMGRPFVKVDFPDF